VRAGFEVTVHDLDRNAADGLLKAGATWSSSPVEAARRSDTIITCLPSPAAVTAVVSDPNGILEGLAPGGTWIDMSTNDFHELQRLAGLAAEKGIA
jgi:3-hydroxyisobutyrate dehydrogenase